MGTGIKELGRSRTFKCQRSAGGLVGWFYCQLSASDILPGNPADVFKLVRRTTARQTCGNQVRKRGVADVSAAGALRLALCCTRWPNSKRSLRPSLFARLPTNSNLAVVF